VRGRKGEGEKWGRGDKEKFPNLDVF